MIARAVAKANESQTLPAAAAHLGLRFGETCPT